MNKKIIFFIFSLIAIVLIGIIIAYFYIENYKTAWNSCKTLCTYQVEEGIDKLGADNWHINIDGKYSVFQTQEQCIIYCIKEK